MTPRTVTVTIRADASQAIRELQLVNFTLTALTLRAALREIRFTLDSIGRDG